MHSIRWCDTFFSGYISEKRHFIVDAFCKVCNGCNLRWVHFIYSGYISQWMHIAVDAIDTLPTVIHLTVNAFQSGCKLQSPPANQVIAPWYPPCFWFPPKAITHRNIFTVIIIDPITNDDIIIATTSSTSSSSRVLLYVWSSHRHQFLDYWFLLHGAEDLLSWSDLCLFRNPPDVCTHTDTGTHTDGNYHLRRFQAEHQAMFDCTLS